MAYLEIPLNSDRSFYSFKIELEQETFTFELRYNTRMNSWIYSIFTGNEIPILEGKPLVTNVDLLAAVTNQDKPQGVLFAYNMTDGKTDPARNTLGTDVKLFYSEANA